MKDQVALLQLMQARGLGARTLGRTLSQLAREGRTPADLVAASADELIRFGLTPETARAVAAGRSAAEKAAEDLDQQNVRMLIRGTTDYPPRLRDALADHAPPVLFVAGNPNLLASKGVAFCGARDASTAALRVTQDAARRLAERGVNVISGHANGVDLTAHVAALTDGGTTTLVLAEGILRFRAKPGLSELLGDHNFMVVSEFSPRLTWSVGNAMQRNATVCGLADAVIVVEAGRTGGTYAAGEKALELNRPLFVVAFRQPPDSATGNALLLSRGGRALPCENSGELDLAGVFQALDSAGQPATPTANSNGVAAVVQRDLFDDTGVAE